MPYGTEIKCQLEIQLKVQVGNWLYLGLLMLLLSDLKFLLAVSYQVPLQVVHSIVQLTI